MVFLEMVVVVMEMVIVAKVMDTVVLLEVGSGGDGDGGINGVMVEVRGRW